MEHELKYVHEPRIQGVSVKPLEVIPDERGRVMEILRRDDPAFAGFGQVYVTTVYPGVVKAWHLHRRQWDQMAVVRGAVRLALYDDRPGSPSQGVLEELYLDERRPLLVRVPPGVYHGMKGVGTVEAIVVNAPSEPYDHEAPDEYRLPPDDPGIGYDWGRRDG